MFNRILSHLIKSYILGIYITNPIQLGNSYLSIPIIEGSDSIIITAKYTPCTQLSFPYKENTEISNKVQVLAGTKKKTLPIIKREQFSIVK